MALLITGDTHGALRYEYDSPDGFVTRFNRKNFPVQMTLSKEDYVIICGDFGGIFDTDRRYFRESEFEKHHLDWLDTRNFTTLFVPGNHENYDRLSGIKDEAVLNCWLYEKMDLCEKEKLRRGYPRKAWHGGFVREIRPSVLMLEAGVFEIGGYRCFVYGGAASHDTEGGILNPADYANETQYRQAYERTKERGLPFRVNGLTWWRQEIPDSETKQAAWNALEAVNFEVDLVFSHDCHMAALSKIRPDSSGNPVNHFLESVREKLIYDDWYFGHYHDNIDFADGKTHMLYERVVRKD